MCQEYGLFISSLVSVEEKGGRYTWSNGSACWKILTDGLIMYISIRSEIRKIKRDITIGIVISMLLALLTTVMCNTA